MSGWAAWAVAVIVGCMAGEVWFRFRKAAEFVRGERAGQLARAAEARWQRAPFNSSVDGSRRRSPDFQLVTRQPPTFLERPVLHHPRSSR